LWYTNDVRPHQVWPSFGEWVTALDVRGSELPLPEIREVFKLYERTRVVGAKPWFHRKKNVSNWIIQASLPVGDVILPI
jgi:hypothetical protein